MPCLIIEQTNQWQIVIVPPQWVQVCLSLPVLKKFSMAEWQ